MLNRNINSQVLFMPGPPTAPPTTNLNLNVQATQPERAALLKSITDANRNRTLKKVDPSLIKDRSELKTALSIDPTTKASKTQDEQPKQKPITQQTPGNTNLAAEAALKSNILKSTRKNLWGKNNPNSTTTTQQHEQMANGSTGAKPLVPPRSNATNQAAALTRNKNNKKTIQSPENPSGSTNSISKINFEKQSGFLMALVKLIVNFCRIFYSNAFHAKQTDPKAEKMSKMFKDVNSLICQNTPNTKELSTKLGQMKNCIEIYNKNGKPCFNQFRAEQFNELIDKAVAKNLIQIA
jgi:hypothetical protein